MNKGIAIQNDIPTTWKLLQIGDVCSTTSGGTPSRKIKKYYEGEIPWVKSGELNDGLVSNIEEHITKEAISESSAKIFPAGTLLIALYGATVGKLGILTKDAATNQAICAIFPPENINQKFLFWYLRYIRSDLIASAIGGAQPNINQGIIKSTYVPIAPLNEQIRIVAEIEKQFSRLDEAVANLKRVKANLKRYKAAVLKAAVEGKLTAEWRKNHPDVEPADKLLECILTERRQKWEESELADMKAKGKVPKDDQWKKKYKEIAQIDMSFMPTPPNKWTWTTLPQLGELNRGKSKHRPRNAPVLYGGTYPFVQTGDVRHATGTINDYSQTYSEEGLKQSRLWPKGTLCITIAANIADTALLGFDACFPDSIVGFIPSRTYIEVKFIEYFLRTAKENLERYAPATAQKNINLAILSDIAVPLPPEKEQKIIIDEIEKCLSVAERIEISIDKNLARADRLRQSILKKAFSGKLVPRNNNDEPAQAFSR